jgi:hypothetical protein
VLEIERGQLDLLRARQALEAGQVAAASRHVEAASERLSAGSAPVGPALKTETLTEAVIATRALKTALAELSPPIEALAIAADGSWFRPPHGKRADLDNRPTLARVLKALLDARLQAPGAPLGVGPLTQAGWPGQTIIASAAQNRINVALTTLRKLGLGDLVLRADDGWLLDPTISAVRLSLRACSPGESRVSGRPPRARRDR